MGGDRLVHPSYINGEKYNYMVLSLNKKRELDIIFYQLNSKNHLKISKFFFDKNNRFISRHRIDEVIKVKKVQSCSENIRRLF